MMPGSEVALPGHACARARRKKSERVTLRALGIFRVGGCRGTAAKGTLRMPSGAAWFATFVALEAASFGKCDARKI